MTARILNPMVVAAAALILSVAAGAASFWLKADVVVGRLVALRQQRFAVAAAKAAEIHAQGFDFWTIEVANLETELKDEKLAYQQKEDGLKLEKLKLDAEAQELERTRTEIQGMRQEIDNRVVAIRADEAKNLHGLAQTYSTLALSSPSAAVAILREMDDLTVVKILFLMKADVVGAIFQEMATTQAADGSTLAKRAAQLSEKLRLMKTAQVAAP